VQQARRKFFASPFIAVLGAALALMIIMCLPWTWPVRRLQPFGEDNARDEVCEEP